jgi:predicted acetyltransferase
VSRFDVRAATPADHRPLSRMLELYQHDLSDIWDQDLDANGEYGYDLDSFWRAPGCHAFVALAEGHYAGFALVDTRVRVGTQGRWMDQFCVVKKYRRRGAGRQLACAVFDALPGRWEVGQMPDNHAAQAFWRRVIAQYSGGRFTEHTLRDGAWQGVVQVFDSAAAP